MDLRQLEALVEIDERGSFSAAAAALGTVQSNVSARIARLERELDASLVDRGSGRLTEEGASVAVRARRILAEVDAAGADVTALRSEVVGTAGIGVIGTVGRWLVPQLLDAVRSAHPHVSLRIVEGTSSTLEPQLASGQLDLAVITLPLHVDALSTTHLFDEDLVLVVPVGHPLTRVPAPIKFAELGDLDLLLPLTGTALRDELDEAAAAAGVELSALIELDGLRTLASLAFDGYGPALLPATAVPRHLRDRFASVQVQGLGRRHVGIAVRRHGLPAAPSRVVRALLEELVASGPLPDGLHPAA
ncbi:MAG TPA: LysR family transcriptional regulator [Acidimicrobiales bacterium]|nr:LysR family transcriptional regulator [Acidimicrobiales bacterium]